MYRQARKLKKLGKNGLRRSFDKFAVEAALAPSRHPGARK